MAAAHGQDDVTADTPPTITQQPQGQTAYEGCTIRLSVAASGALPFRYLWFKDGEPLRSETEEVLNIDALTIEDAGSYTVRVSNGAGEVFSDVSVITVLPVTGLDSGRVAYWTLDETSGNTAGDSSGNANNGDLVNFGGDPWKEGVVNNALEFDGLTSHVSTADSASLNEVGPDATFAFWINPRVYGVEQGAGDFTHSASYVLRKGDHFGIRVINDPGTITRTISVRANVGGDDGRVPRQDFEANPTQGSLELGVWQHFTVVYKGGTIRFYKDGVPVGEAVDGTLGEIDFSPLIIGSYNELGHFERFLDGQLDEVAIWDRPISEAEILEIAGKDVAGPPAIEVQPISRKKLEGTTVSFQVVSTGKRPVLYQWFKDGDAIDGANESILTFFELNVDDAGVYTVTVTNELGEAASAGAALEVEPLGLITSGLAAYYDFNEPSGESVADSSGNDLTGTLFNFQGGGFESGIIGGALRFDGEDDFVTIPHDDVLNLGTEATVAVWVRPNPGANDRVFRKDVNYDFVFQPNGIARVHGINKTPYNSPTGTVETELWQHFAYVVRNGTIQWYKDGEPVGAALNGQLGGVNTMPLILGNYEAQDDNWINRPYDGVMDDLGIWQRALTPDEINGIYQNGLQGKPLTEEFEPLNIRSIASEDDNVRLTYYNPFANREVVIYSTADIGAAWSNLDVAINDLGDSLFDTVFPAPASAGFYKIGALAPPPIFFDDFESGAPGWTTDVSLGGTEWELGVPTTGPGQAFSGNNVYATGLSEDFLINTTTFLLSPVIDLTDYSRATLSFWEFRNMDPPVEQQFFHGARVSVLDADTLLPLQVLSTLAGTTNGWEQRADRLAPDAVGRRIILEFTFFADEFFPNEGWFIDDVSLLAE